ncbi:hypothetical protein HN018_14225 [Lichenicola cladoniae]|uniref:Uncharacterized protein n=1 Tax=Lichenicola cladoniae TaxID=1484109 RepID=A0A6M8HRZ2_9PROT|nr:hypothetical protein [Lichenicola cladoniae]NPD65966.1 hypothetical protein [Acetobacteraceae bacterium]QKE91046.1 hypothetical protein HN018_14225 [Lichenicola cladoniae]
MTRADTRPEPRRGVIVMHAFGPYQEGQFLEDPVLIDKLVADGESWRINEAVLLVPPS